VAILFLASCSSGEDAIPQPPADPEPKVVVPEDVPVSFSPKATDGGTRAPIPAGALSPSVAFRVWATKKVTGTAAEEAFINDNTRNTVVYDTRNSLWATTGATYYWPDTPETLYDVTFYAMYPASAPTTADISTDKTVSFTATSPIDGDTDVMYTMVTTSLTDMLASSSVSVPLQFRHTLTQVAFKGKASTTFQEKGWTVTVGGIRVCNVNSTGVLDLTTGVSPWNPATVTPWTPSAAPTLTNYTLTMLDDDDDTTDGLVLTGDVQPLTSTDIIPMLMPQALTPWNPETNCIYTTDVSTKTATTGGYLAIDLKIYDSVTDSYSIGDNHTYETVYVPFCVDPAADSPETVSWHPGYRYTYTITFGSGYDSQGQALDARLIDVSVSITPWDEVEPSNGIAA
jgi:hypothetical protein